MWGFCFAKNDLNQNEFFSLCLWQVNLLCVAIQHGDQQSVQYLLKEARITVPLDPSNTNPAILAAYCGHANLVKELLDSLPGR